ncbi:MAG: DUF2240 family protein [Candidatus Verstraetearchaeota archaeon]|nr:DUF2240 family protein [Candidatus Verstraetearchaeota archaeon]
MIEFAEILKRIRKEIGLSEAEFRELVEAKMRSLGYLVDEEAAALLVAKELGMKISTEDGERRWQLRIEDLVPGLTNLNLEGYVVEVERERGPPVKFRIGDGTGTCLVLVWKNEVSALRVGVKVRIQSAYTKQGREEVEVHVGDRGKAGVVAEPCRAVHEIQLGKVLRVFGKITFQREGGEGAVSSCLIDAHGKLVRLVAWNGRADEVARLKEGDLLVVINGRTRRGLKGVEVHVDDEAYLEVLGRTQLKGITRKKLSELKPGDERLSLEGVVETIYPLRHTRSGKPLLKLIISDGETALPLFVWGEAAEKIEASQEIRLGTRIKVSDCYVRVGSSGMEVHLSRWGRIEVLNR